MLKSKFIEVKETDIKELAALAFEIWHEYFPCLISTGQIDYMVDKFQSEDAIIRQIQDENYHYYFIISDDKKAGYFGLAEKEEYFFLSKLYIKNEFRRKGIGKQAFSKITELARETNYDKIRLTVNKQNKNTIAAYLKYGFEIIAEDITDIGHGFVMDDYIMQYFIK